MKTNLQNHNKNPEGVKTQQPALPTLALTTHQHNFQLPSFGELQNPWEGMVPVLNWVPNDEQRHSEWWRRLEQKGLSPGHVFVHCAESEEHSARGRDRRHSV